MTDVMTVGGVELFVWARTIYGEARGEGLAGQIAVAWVIRNRVTTDLGNDGKPDWWGEGVIGVCRAPRQFSCWNKEDPNSVVIQQVTFDDPVFQQCVYVAIGVAHGIWPDPTAGSKHYHSDRVSPKWAEGQPYITIGRHRFFSGLN